MGKTEKRVFNVHPGIIKHLIKEQAGTLVKAVTELVMNSVDAGATRIDLNFRKDGTFTVKDNGRGFRDRGEIENFFETFGTPHTEGDATYGRFRIGRGQIMAFANTTWRSGNFSMDVRLLDEGADFGYTLTETTDSYAGCQIDGVILDENLLYEARYSGLMEDGAERSWGDDVGFRNAVRFVKVPIYLAGNLVSTGVENQKWTLEDEYGYYLFDKSYGLTIYNQGIYVTAEDRRVFSVGGIFVSKKPMKLNMARNAWLEYECEVVRHLRRVARSEYLDSIERSAKISSQEVGAIVHRIAQRADEIDENEALLLFDTRFISILGGGKVSPREFLRASRYSFYDGESSLIGERAMSEGMIGLLLPEMFRLASLRGGDGQASEFIGIMLDLFEPWVDRLSRVFHPFSKIMQSYSGTFKAIPDAELSPQKLAALNAIRYVRYRLKMLAGDTSQKMRKMIAGKSDCANAWTNGFDYIAFDESALEFAYLTDGSGGIERLVNLAIHEFCHQTDSSADTHEHTLEFYRAYHEATLMGDYGETVRMCHRRYLQLLLKGGDKISSKDRNHAGALRKVADEMDSKYPVRKRPRPARNTVSGAPEDTMSFDGL